MGEEWEKEPMSLWGHAQPQGKNPQGQHLNLSSSVLLTLSL